MSHSMLHAVLALLVLVSTAAASGSFSGQVLVAAPGSVLADSNHSLEMYYDMPQHNVSLALARSASMLPLGSVVLSSSPEMYIGSDVTRSLVVVSAPSVDVAHLVRNQVESEPVYAYGSGLVFDVALTDVAKLQASVAQASLETVAVPMAPEPMMFGVNGTARLEEVLARVETMSAPDAAIAKLGAQISPAHMRQTLDYLTGKTSTLTTRQSGSEDAVKVSDWIEVQLEGLGLEIERDNKSWKGYSDDIYGTLPGLHNETYILIGAHYDSCGQNTSSTTDPAPGANSNGSGVAALLEMARVLALSDRTFNASIRFAFWTAGCQGYWGTRWRANLIAVRGWDMVAYMSADMVAYRPPGNPIEIGIKSRWSTPIANEVFLAVMALYEPEVRTCYSLETRGSQTPFFFLDLIAMGVTDTCGFIRDPAYRQADDVVDRPGFDLDGQLTVTTRGLLASAVTMIGGIV
ncbi:peptidase M28 [Thecamonas trahens ATCC 50062]|uniref:Peptidase M28 n=1 Tax=Thecamonas trahens ATCC 50062 TaxID=461836 RepID=A0A0L0D3H4_THETB|nr:peptidase M28 [Thecamonas trahens ATCC 50062]KNC46750.1 peptidase M28 [Thecamonas trahens ATCC 50062]|eukprot:XP_013760030.1 peptidase M28 [Thecamonas trahens ATCC 50062]